MRGLRAGVARGRVEGQHSPVEAPHRRPGNAPAQGRRPPGNPRHASRSIDVQHPAPQAIPAPEIDVHRRIRSAAILALALVAVGPVRAASDLPAIGDPVDQVLSPRDEAAIGREMMARARDQLDLNRDPEVAAYVDSVGQRLTAQVDNRPVNGFTFFVVHDPRINAFAAPGGYIGVNSGLFLKADNEAELAGVMAHEIAHVTQRHIARAYAASQRASYKTIAAVLAGLILGAQDPQAGQAAITSGVAAQAQSQINYTRQNENEADRIGIGYLAAAGYDPGAMADMFGILQRAAGGSGNAEPEFLRTHPLTTNRIAEAQGRAAQMHVQNPREDTLAFHLMQTRLQVMESDEPRALASRWHAEQVPDDKSYDAAARRYGLALLNLRDGDPGAAAEALRALHDQDRDNLHYGLALARADQALGQIDSAIERWRSLRDLYPGSYAVAATGADFLVAAGRAPEAVDVMTSYLRRDGAVAPEAWRDLAEAAQAAGRPARSHEALGEFYVHTDRLARALDQLQLALAKAEKGSPEALRLKARIDQVRTEQHQRIEETPVSGS